MAFEKKAMDFSKICTMIYLVVQKMSVLPRWECSSTVYIVQNIVGRFYSTKRQIAGLIIFLEPVGQKDSKSIIRPAIWRLVE